MTFGLVKQTINSTGEKLAGSALVKRLIGARNDPAKERIRGWLIEIDDARLLDFGLTPTDIAALRKLNER